VQHRACCVSHHFLHSSVDQLGIWGKPERSSALLCLLD
jgi:hypothetical protein